MSNTLLIIDMQVGFVKAESQHILPVVQELVTNEQFSTIIQTEYVNPRGSTLEKALGWTGLRSKKESHLLFPIRGSQIIQRAKYSAATPKLLSLLNKNDRIYICGLETDACVLATAYSLFDEGYDIKVIKDAVASNSRFGEQGALEIIERNFGKDSLVLSDEILF